MYRDLAVGADLGDCSGVYAILFALIDYTKRHRRQIANFVTTL